VALTTGIVKMVKRWQRHTFWNT